MSCSDLLDPAISHTTVSLDMLQNWFLANRLKLNSAKTKFSILTKSHFIPAISEIQTTSFSIARMPAFKLLGVYIEDLSWKTHLSHICTNLSRAIAVIYKLRPLLNPQAFTLHNTFFSPHLTYCCTIWAASRNSNLRAIDILQHRVLKIFLKLPVCTPSIELHSELKVMKIADISNYQWLIYIFKLLSNLARDSFGGCLISKPSISQRHTRSTNEFSQL